MSSPVEKVGHLWNGVPGGVVKLPETTGSAPHGLAFARPAAIGGDWLLVSTSRRGFIASSSIGLAVGGESIPCVAGWGEDGALDAVTEFAATIDALARRIEDVLAAESEVRKAPEHQAGPCGSTVMGRGVSWRARRQW